MAARKSGHIFTLQRKRTGYKDWFESVLILYELISHCRFSNIQKSKPHHLVRFKLTISNTGFKFSVFLVTHLFIKTHIFELKSQNRNLNSLLCEIFTYMAVKVQKIGNLTHYSHKSLLALSILSPAALQISAASHHLSDMTTAESKELRRHHKAIG